ncbi:winged helix-turn-helix domain-containing protein [Halobaculum sp. MBLA0147]|uniref:winged helix-turn-helix domain-containing protein n=1 Tax=Halobaculum sp. MBLA0147 TaxID=3079934 RepID=UPI0035239C05
MPITTDDVLATFTPGVPQMAGEIADELGVTHETVRKRLHELAENDRVVAHDHGRPTSYRIPLPGDPEAGDVPTQTPDGDEPDTPTAE